MVTLPLLAGLAAIFLKGFKKAIRVAIAHPIPLVAPVMMIVAAKTASVRFSCP
jgi:hypothetical protein